MPVALPLDFASFKLEGFEGLNVHTSRLAIGDQQLAWCHNIYPHEAGNARSIPGKGADIYETTPEDGVDWTNADGDFVFLTNDDDEIVDFLPAGGTGALRTIVFFYPFNIGDVAYHAVFMNDGAAVQVRVSDGLATPINMTAGTFYDGGQLPSCAQWGAEGILIVSTVDPDAYWAWDGTLYEPGDAAPAWLDGGAGDNIPNGVQGTSIEVFQSRVWIDNGPTFMVSAPGNGCLFGASDGGVTATSTDSFLRYAYKSIRQTNGFLYNFGDSSVNVISNVITAGSPATTTFNNSNLDPQVGAPWRDSVMAFGRALIFGNPVGIYALYGGAADKQSTAIDDLLETIDTTAITPSAAVHNLYNSKIYIFLATVQNPFTSEFSPMLICWDGKRWFTASQEVDLTFINTQEINSQLQAWGTDGNRLFRLFDQPSATLPKQIKSKLWAAESFALTKQALGFVMSAQDLANAGFDVQVTIESNVQQEILNFSFASTLVFVGTGPIQFTGAGGEDLNFISIGVAIGVVNANMAGRVLGFTLDTLSPDFQLIAFELFYKKMALLPGLA